MNALTETEVAEAAIVIFADTETLGDLARAVNTLETVKEFKEAGDEVVLIVDGAGVRRVAELSKPDHRSHRLYQAVETGSREPAPTAPQHSASRNRSSGQVFRLSRNMTAIPASVDLSAAVTKW